MKISPGICLLGILLLFALSCSEDDDISTAVDLLSASLDGSNLVDGAENIPTSTSLMMVFSKSLDPVAFESSFSISPAAEEMNFSYSNQSSKVTINLKLALNTNYVLSIESAPIGQNGESLGTAIRRSFTTMEDAIITSLPACTSASNDCLRTFAPLGAGQGEFDFYSSFPIFEEQAKWEELEAAIIVIHGANRDADNYFSYLIGVLQAQSLEDKVALLAPFFRNNQEANGDELYWSNTGWRSGNNTLGPSEISSFAIVDQLLDQLADQEHFPVLQKVIITGHSSGAFFTHLFAAANVSEAQYAHLTFEHVPVNSQYYYYPDGQRMDESTNQLYTPTGCGGYDIWPFGFNVVPTYLAGTDEGTFNQHFVNRSITYLLGNGTAPDPTLNTTDCNATVLGSSRFSRGENMFRYMELVYPMEHQHQKAIVPGIGHNGQAMYQSSEFRTLLVDLLN